MHSFVFNLQETDRTKLSVAGGKGANLGELIRIGRINVPDGFCVSTEAYKRVIGESPLINTLIDQLSLLKTGEHDKISKISREIREAIEQITIPRDIADDITRFLMMKGVNTAYAVRSSATAEDLPTASFAGQQDTYLNVIGKDIILMHVTRCWASLFTDRAIIYRLQSGFDHRKVHLAVIVQQMIYPDAAGIMFTADPVTSNRKILSIDASFGLGEALVSGRVNPDIYKVREGRMVSKKISAKELAIYAAKEGGTKEQVIDHELQNKQVLTDEQIFQLEHTGRKIEAHFGSPQDIEWCLADNTFYIVQSRPITTLFPVPEANDEDNHVYVSVGHQQMMTDPVRPLGISVWQLTGGRPMYNAGGRLFVDVAPNLATATGRQNILDVLGHSDPLIKDALTTIIERGDFIKSVPKDKGQPVHIRGHQGMSAGDILAEAGNDPAVVTDLIKQSEASLAALKHNIQTKSGLDVFDCIVQDMQLRRQRTSEAKNLNVIMAAIHASAWLNEKMDEWLGEKNAADAVSLSVPNNVTSEMGMELLDVADVIRPYPEIIKYLEQENGDDFLDELVQFEGGRQVRDAIIGYLDKYGMRCGGEIDITRTRWSEKPGILLPMILSNIRNVEPGASKRKFEQGRQQALKKEQDLLGRLKALPDGKLKAEQTEKMIGLIRNFIGYREYPKYDIVSRYFIYKQALLKEAKGLVQAGVINEKEDIYFLSFEELREVITTNKLDTTIISHRKDEYKFFEKLTPPRIITSDGEIITGKYKRENLPPDAFIGLAVSSGVIEGRARVVINIEDANLQEGDILITPFTDPSWTPIFLSIKGLVTEVGGLMTHGAVIAREYGLPAVVGLQDATKLIKDGQRIRVNGTEGYVEIL